MRFIIILFFVFISTECFAASVNVSPIEFNLSAKHNSDVLTLTNEANKNLLVELHAYNSYKKNKISHDIFISPPIVNIPAHNSQIIRIALQRTPDPTQQLKYRIFINEVPTKTKKNNGVDIALRLSIPVHVAPLS